MRRLFEPSPLKIGLIVGIIMCFVVIWNPPLVNMLESQLTDVRFKIRGYIEPGPEVAIVAIDEKSVDALGQWPLPREAMAKLVNKLAELGVITIAFDVVFAESGTSSRKDALNMVSDSAAKLGIDKNILNTLLSEIEHIATPDEQFAEALQNSEAGIMGFFFHDNLDNLKHLSLEKIQSDLLEIAPTRYPNPEIAPNADLNFLMEFKGVESSLPLLMENAISGGFLNIEPDADGTLRRFPLIAKAGGNYYAPLFLQALAHFLEEPSPDFEASAYGIKSVRLGDLDIPVDLKAKFLINYYGPGRTFPHYSLIDVIEDRIPQELLDSRIVFIGATGKGLTDLRPTPFDGLSPGVEIHTTIVDNILHSRYLIEPVWYHSFTLVLLILFSLLLSLVLPRVNNLVGVLFALTLLLGYIYANQYIFNQGILTNVIYPSLQIVLVFSAIKAHDYFKQSSKTRFIQSAFGQYLSPEIIKKLIQDPDNLRLGGSEERLTAFFSDVASFSSFSEKMTPSELVDLLNEYLTAMSEIIIKYDGTIDKYEGDAIIAFFGAPVQTPEHATKACLASLEMQEKLVQMRIDWEARGKPEVQVRIGINTGQMVVGNMGSKMRMDYTIMGDSVNLASRLEGVNKIYGTQLMISQFTHEDVAENVETRELDQIRVVGKNEPITIYEVLAPKGKLSPERTEGMNLFAEGLKLYRQQKFEEAVVLFKKVLEILPADGPAKAYIPRCEAYQKEPPPKDWDGVYQMTSK
ncbi:MAG: hypothetical protein COV66_08735 [Nitrospinae bacterium CG11_big_fil_rev_8_21_14_0_20_45_15]|nr:MAG: hypothetical protein COV66_08735 [Nitrospinae bacterium CG11_big_fil_rev_8_21_14_0_20_45_15]